MYILTLEGREEQGAYSVTNQMGQQILYLFEEEDDAVRFAMMLEEDDYPPLVVVEIEDDLIIKTCEVNRYDYAIITANDIVIPPEKNDII
jgi:hypothetical protein